ncbi:MAG: EAL domain-containing protein, partial [Acidimicrobiales bacterium]|nr:EAL domain-containing protein [Acidimicrobiales bacterium]
RHPSRGLLSAFHFIEVAEESGMIDEMGRIALREACRTFARMQASTDQGLQLRVNISAREFARPELLDLVRTALKESGLAPDRLCLEMTETTLMDSPEVALETFQRLHELGVEFAIDDFGTGYSSLTYLKRFPVDAVKIDRGFVEDIVTNNDSRAIVESIMSLATALALDVVAEGIESEQQLELLRSLGCERAQGYLVAGALPPDEFVAFITSA